MSTKETVTGCLVSSAPVNGFVEVQLNDSPLTHRNILSAARKYFTEEAQLKEVRISLEAGGEDDKPFQMIVIFDNLLHGSMKCAYLALKLIDENNVADLNHQDYMTVIRCIDCLLTKIPAANKEEDNTSN
ncbi:hypothetical protein DEU56DRAFT_754130 [Suillus clintonianus]|uniref:uncharacterized protein n=1 Tax=Suillus clintonianus TaxID=1904413 RepID=UPI001B87B06A|nr:uncharacterized protein DEU56DRAFT_754130 [Suillus clintonianus]KAG2145274.1 hypothetical protein DEU56DRAFT_754130 [Suillus clintonianus]